MAIHTDPGTNRRQAICLRFHPIADSHQVLCDAIAQKSYKLAIQNSHSSVP
jgi:hypothetical protein